MDFMQHTRNGSFKKFRMSATLAHLILFGTSAWAMNQISLFKYPWAKASFTLTLGHGALGLGLYVWSKQKSIAPPDVKYERIYWQTSLMVRSLPLLCFNMQILGVKALNSLYTVLPLLSKIQWKRDEKYWNCFNALNIWVMVYLSVVKRDAWVAGFATVGTMIHLMTMGYFGLSDKKPDNSVAIFISILNLFGLQAIYSVNCNR